MPDEELRIVHRHDPQLQSVNAKLASLAAEKPGSGVYTAFALAANLAGDAIAAAEGLMQMPGLEAMSNDGQALQNTLEFWHRVRDYNGAAALAVAGANETLAEALVAFRFVHNGAGETRAWDGRLSSDES